MISTTQLNHKTKHNFNIHNTYNNNSLSNNKFLNIHHILKIDKPTKDEKLNKTYYMIPPKQGRYIVLDTETTGLNNNSQIVEIGCHEIINNKLTGVQFHIYIRPRTLMDDEVIKIHGISNNFYDDFYKDIYANDKQNMINFVKFVGNSLIFAHNATFDVPAINAELKYWGLNQFSIKKFRCTMRIFTEVIGKIDIFYYDKFVNLEKCCEYFNIKSNVDGYHNALFDAFMTARLLCKIYDFIDSNPYLKEIIYRNKNVNKKFYDNINFNNKSNFINRKKYFSSEIKNELTSSTGGENEEDKVNSELENEELSEKVIDKIFKLL